MADTAAHLVDRVFPRVPVRQWVLSLPYAPVIVWLRGIKGNVQAWQVIAKRFTGTSY